MTRDAGHDVEPTSMRSHVSRWVLAVLLVIAAPTIASAQSVPPPATYYSVDSNGVDIVSGAYIGVTHSVSVGQPGMGGLNYTRTYDSGAQYELLPVSWTPS